MVGQRPSPTTSPSRRMRQGCPGFSGQSVVARGTRGCPTARFRLCQRPGLRHPRACLASRQGTTPAPHPRGSGPRPAVVVFIPRPVHSGRPANRSACRTAAGVSPAPPDIAGRNSGRQALAHPGAVHPWRSAVSDARLGTATYAVAREAIGAFLREALSDPNWRGTLRQVAIAAEGLPSSPSWLGRCPE